MREKDVCAASPRNFQTLTCSKCQLSARAQPIQYGSSHTQRFDMRSRSTDIYTDKVHTRVRLTPSGGRQPLLLRQNVLGVIKPGHRGIPYEREAGKCSRGEVCLCLLIRSLLCKQAPTVRCSNIGSNTSNTAHIRTCEQAHRHPGSRRAAVSAPRLYRVQVKPTL